MQTHMSLRSAGIPVDLDGRPRCAAVAVAKDETHRCGNCDVPGAKGKHKGCGVERHCGESPGSQKHRRWYSAPAARRSLPTHRRSPDARSPF